MQLYDKLWKGVIEDFFVDFLYFFYPQADTIFDLSKGYEFLDQELLLIMPESVGQNRYVDKLVKVWLKDGSSRWILIHCEVQGYGDKDFEVRMFVYFYRIYDKYQVEITSIAILSDPNPSYNPNKFEKEFLGTKISFEFNIYKILSQDPKVLEASDNPFALVMLTAYQALKNRQMDDAMLIEIKLDLIKRLIAKKFTKKRIQALFYFIKRYIRFEKKENNLIFEQELEKIYPQKNKKMGVIDIIIEDEKAEARQKGIEQGIEQDKRIVIKNARLKGCTTEFIAEIVSLSEVKVRQILNELGIE
jgi:predicted transposase/invertase (TIGR01784 family)